MSYAIIKVVDVTHMGLLRQITGNWARRKGDGAWETRLSEEVIQASGYCSRCWSMFIWTARGFYRHSLF